MWHRSLDIPCRFPRQRIRPVLTHFFRELSLRGKESIVRGRRRLNVAFVEARAQPLQTFASILLGVAQFDY